MSGDSHDALRAFLAAELDDGAGGSAASRAAADTGSTQAAFSVQRHEAGHSNETLFVTAGDRELVVRRPPPGETAETAHDVLREYRVLEALYPTEVPVPRPIVACSDPSVIGAEFYVMERVTGDVLREEPARLADPAARGAISDQIIDTLAGIHSVSPSAVGLSAFGRPSGFTERQVNRWAGQYQWAFQTTIDERPVPAVYEVTEWLVDHAPSDHPETLVHGDFKPDNLVAAPDRPAIAATLDWELATLGDPRTDLGWLLSVWRDDGDPDAVLDELGGTFTHRDGYPSRRELVDRWEAATGFDYEHDRFYRTLAVYKLGALGEMFFRRHIESDASDPLYPKMREAVPALAQRCLRIIDGEE